MPSYFPLPPNIELEFNQEKILGSLTFLNFPSNLQKKHLSKVCTKGIYIGIYILDNALWRLVKIQNCPYKEFVEINRTAISLSDSEMAVAIIRKKNDFPKLCENLPKPDSLRVDKARVAERASYNFTYKSFQTSYQGEYPAEMLNIPKATFFSFYALNGINTAGEVKNYLLLINLNISSQNSSIRNVKVYDPRNNLILQELEARQNLISVHDMSFLVDSKSSEKIFFMSSNESAFIPLMLTLDRKLNHLSLEHTHPPGEMFWGNDKWNAIRLIKKQWT